jgi:hypothetical protein
MFVTGICALGSNQKATEVALCLHEASHLGRILAVRVVTWNLYNRGVAGARLQGELLRKLSPDLMLLQEVISARLKLSARGLALTG